MATCGVSGGRALSFVIPFVPFVATLQPPALLSPLALSLRVEQRAKANLLHLAVATRESPHITQSLRVCRALPSDQPLRNPIIHYPSESRDPTRPPFALIVYIIGQDRKRDRQADADAWEQMDAAQ